MIFSETTPELLADTAIENLDKKVNYPPIPATGAQNAAQFISALL